jgi:hypothetical protein
MSFWSTLAGIGTSLIPGVGPFIAPLVAGGINAITGGGGGSNPTSTNNGGVGVNPTYQKSPLVQQGIDALSPAQTYYKGILGGDRDKLQGLLGPEISTVLSQYDNAAKTAAEFAPRGGGANRVLAEAPFEKAGAYGKMLAGARTGAAAGLAGIGEKIATVGTEEERGQNTFATSLARLNFERQQEQNKQISGLTGGIGSILANIFGNKTRGGKTFAQQGGAQFPMSPSFDPGLKIGDLTPSGDTVAG